MYFMCFYVQRLQNSNILIPAVTQAVTAVVQNSNIFIPAVTQAVTAVMQNSNILIPADLTPQSQLSEASLCMSLSHSAVTMSTLKCIRVLDCTFDFYTVHLATRVNILSENGMI